MNKGFLTFTATIFSVSAAACGTSVQDLGSHDGQALSSPGADRGGDAPPTAKGVSPKDPAVPSEPSASEGPSTSPAVTSQDPLAGTSADHPPYGIWTMAVQYGPPGEPVTPTVPLQVELRPDGTAYRWMCAGAPADGSVTEPCPISSRIPCGAGTVAFTGTGWMLEFPGFSNSTFPNQGSITPDGKGQILIPYINPTYSGALFRRVSASSTGAACPH